MLRAVRLLSTNKIDWKKTKNQELKLYRTVRYYSERSQCPTPPPKKSTNTGTVVTLGLIAVVSGGAIAYAKYDDDFREKLVCYIPAADTIIKYIFQERGSPSITSTIMGIRDKLAEPNKPEGGSGDESSSSTYVAPKPVIPKLSTKCKDEYTEIRIEKRKANCKDVSVEIGGTVKPAEEDFPPSHPQKLAELEAQICAAAEESVNAYQTALVKVRDYMKDVEKIIDVSVDRIEPEVWTSIRRKAKDKDHYIKLADTKATEATQNIDELKKLVSAKEFIATDNTRDIIKGNINKVKEDIASAAQELQAELKNSNVTNRYWNQVERARLQFQNELESLFPTIDLADRKLKIPLEDLDLFLLHVYSTVLFYQKEVAKLETVGKERLKAAFQEAKKKDGGAFTASEVCEMLDQEKRKLTLCFQQQCLKLRQETEHKMREQLKKQSQAFTDHLTDAIKTKEMEIERVLSRKFDEQLENERCQYKIKLAAMIGRLQGFDAGFKAKIDSDKLAKQSHILWAACQALIRSLRAGCVGVPWFNQIRSLEPEINAVRQASADDDELVLAVLDALPKEAIARGVFPEEALRERFLKVEKMARSLALVSEKGAPLPVHILSFIQSLFLLKAASPIPQAELNDEETDFTKLNTNDILQRARYWLDRGDFEQTLKYMNLLKGAPRCVAKQWMNETRILLETQQAANTLMAHAASSGLSHL